MLKSLENKIPIVPKQVQINPVCVRVQLRVLLRSTTSIAALLELRLAHAVLRWKITSKLPECVVMLSDQRLRIHHQWDAFLWLHYLSDLAKIVEYKIV